MNSEASLRKAYEASKYVPDILNAIVSNYGSTIPLTHDALALKLNISKSNLSNVINRLKILMILNIEKVGLNKYYSLTEFGFELYQYSLMMNKNRNEKLINELKILETNTASINLEASKSIKSAIDILEENKEVHTVNKYQYLKYGNSIFRYPALQDNKGYGNIGEKYLKDQNKWVMSYTATMIKNDALGAIEISEEEMKSLIEN